MAEELTDKNFQEKISQGNVAVDFWAPWCGPCKQMGPEYAAAAEEAEGMTLYKLNVDESPEAAGGQGIRGIPTVIFFKDGKEVGRFSGAKDKAAILEEASKAFN